MRKRTIVCIVLIGLLAFLAWWLWPLGGKKPVAEINPATASEAPAAGSWQPRGSPQPTTPAPAAVPIPAKPELKAQLREMMNDANRPISFYGLVIDQDRNPIPGVKVTFQIRRTKAIGPIGIGDTFDYPSLTTGADGRFSVTGATGAVLVVKSFEKPGYEPSEKATRGMYWYWREPMDAYRPSSEQPEVFQMWKKSGAEKLVRNGISAPLRYDGTASTLDLLNGRVAENGDLRVVLMRNPQQITYGQRNYEWTLTLESLGGGLIESKDEQMYLAPAEGYQTKIVIHMPAAAADWVDEKSFKLYVKLHDGKQYGRAELKVLVGSDRETTPFYITVFVNPSGSRNLEYDPLQDVAKPPTPTPKP
jgi:hypothetical protein